MTATVLAQEFQVEQTPSRRRAGIPLLPLIFVYLVVWSFTGAHFMADTDVYTDAISAHQHGGTSQDYRLLTSNPFWDFGHLLWRPLGWFAFVMLRPITGPIAHGNERAEILLTLFAINFAAGLACVLLFFKLAERICRLEWVAAGMACALLFADAFLNYAHSGSPYLAGLTFLIAGMCLLLRAPAAASRGTALSVALMFAMAVFCWLPYVLVLPAAAAVPLLTCGNDRERRTLTANALLLCAAIGVVIYGCAVAVAGIRTLPDLERWILASGHGQIQQHGVRAIARLAFSVPRSFINMDRDGMWLKRYLVRDPYAPMTLSGLFRLSLWKPLVFYIAAAFLCLELWLSKSGRLWTLLVAVSALPIVGFALFIFEAGSIERYLPLYPFILLAYGYALASRNTRYVSRSVLICALVAMALVNVRAMSRWKLQSVRFAAVTRILPLLPQLGPKSLVMAVNEQDNLAEFRHDFPLDDINVNASWQGYDMLEINSERLATWRRDFARQVLVCWGRDGDVWLPKRIFATRPKADWNWVEGDDRRVKWSDLPSFFSQFHTGVAVGGDDGFVLLERDDSNEKKLLEINKT